MTLRMQRMWHSMTRCTQITRAESTKHTDTSFALLLNQLLTSLLSALIAVPIFVVLHSVIVRTSVAP